MNVPTNHFDDWDGSVASARALQDALALQVVRRDGFARPLRTVAGLDVGFEDDGRTTRAVAVLLDADSRQPLATHVACLPTSMPYVPGLLSFRTLPALLMALEALPQTPDLVFVAGHGIAHPRGLGVASHVGVVSGLPTIGVATTILFGTGNDPHPLRGAYTPLRHRGTQIGWLLRSKLRCDPLVLSPGHRVSVPSTADLVMRFVGDDRLPEPTRLADHLASHRDRT